MKIKNKKSTERKEGRYGLCGGLRAVVVERCGGEREGGGGSSPRRGEMEGEVVTRPREVEGRGEEGQGRSRWRGGGVAGKKKKEKRR